MATAVPMAMVLMDYALSGWTATPLVDAQEFAKDIPADLVEASRPLRAALAYGTALKGRALGAGSCRSSRSPRLSPTT